MSSLSTAAARLVLARYPPALRDGALTPLGNHGGFSGARLWRLEGTPGALCLRAWPLGDPSPQRLQFIHQLSVRAHRAGRHCIPVPLAAQDGGTWVEHAGRLWELTPWMPGRADFRDHPTAARLAAACTELAHLHETWANVSSRSGPCPAVERRLDRVRAWRSQFPAGWRLPCGAGEDDPLHPWVERAWRLLPPLVARLPEMLASWRGRQWPLQPCLCDVWHDHVLYEGERVSGLIDLGSVKVDHVSVDLARLLGSMVGSDSNGWECGLRAYRAVRAFGAEEEALARVLDQTGVVVAAMTWLRWLYVEGRIIEDRNAAARRLAALVERMQVWE
jgi:homoserine kinase type II